MTRKPPEKKFTWPKPEPRPELEPPTYTQVPFGGWRAHRGNVAAYGQTQDDACASLERMEALLGSIPELPADKYGERSSDPEECE